MEKNSFAFEITVPPEAIDELGHVNNVTYLEWVQEASYRHWSSVVPEAVQQEGNWVVLNHFIEYKAPAFKDEVLQLKTWVESMEGVKSKRHVEISRKKDQKLLVKALTLWCYIDVKSQKPKRIPEELTKLFID